MVRVVHVHEDCEHYNDRDDRECYFEAEGEFIARLHNGLIHGHEDDTTCAHVVETADTTEATA